MASLKIYSRANTRPAGFSLIELLIVTAIFALLAGLGLFVSFKTYRTYDFQDEVGRVVSALQTVRSQAMTNIDDSAHGLCYDDPSHSFYLFTGPISPSPCTGNRTIPLAKTVHLGPTSWAVIFDQLSGQTTDSSLALTYESKTITIKINEIGRINWE